MPTREVIENTLIPKDIPKPIPVRTVSTRGHAPKPKIAGAPAAENPQQVAASDGNPAAASATTEESVRLSPAASALARKEQQFRQREQAFKQREQEFAAWKEKAEKYDQLTSKMSAKDYSEAEKLGLSYDEYTKYKLAQANGEDPVAQELAALKAKIDELTKGQEESANRDFEDSKSFTQKEIAAAVSNNPEFSSIKHFGEKGHQAVLQLMLDSLEEDGIEMTVEQACKDIEAEIVAQGKEYSALPKLKPAPVAQETELPQPKPSASTLTNNMLPPSGDQGPKKSLQHLSESERYAEARRRVLARRAQQQGT